MLEEIETSTTTDADVSRKTGVRGQLKASRPTHSDGHLKTPAIYYSLVELRRIGTLDE